MQECVNVSRDSKKKPKPSAPSEFSHIGMNRYKDRDILYISYMPITEAQRRAQKKWKEANKERYNAYRLAWQKTKEGYAEKQREYVRRCRSKKKDFMEEVRRLLDIEIL